MAEQLLNGIQEKLDEGDITIWGETLNLVRGPLTFRHRAESRTPCPVTDVYLVLGGVYGSEAHYRMQLSDNGTYHYVHRLSYYRLNPSTFREMTERAVMTVLTALKDAEKVIACAEADMNVTVTSADDAVQLTCCRGGGADPDWIIRLMPAIAGQGRPPPPIDCGHRPWLVVPPPRVCGPYASTWEVKCLSGGSSMLGKAAACAVYEAECGRWGGGKVDFDRLFDRIILDVDDVSCESLSGKFEFLLNQLVARLDERRGDDYVPDDVVDDVIGSIKLAINCDLEVKVRGIEESIDRYLAVPEISSVDGPTRIDETCGEMRREFGDLGSKMVDKRPVSNGTQKSNGTVPYHGACNGVVSKKSTNEAERTRKRYFTIFSICLVLVVVGFVFVVAWFEDNDVIKLMYDGKFAGFADNSKEF